MKASDRREFEQRERQQEAAMKRARRQERRRQKLARKFADYESEEEYGSAHDLREFLRYVGKREDY
jgi:hypothetical protein